MTAIARVLPRATRCSQGGIHHSFSENTPCIVAPIQHPTAQTSERVAAILGGWESTWQRGLNTSFEDRPSSACSRSAWGPVLGVRSNRRAPTACGIPGCSSSVSPTPAPALSSWLFLPVPDFFSTQPRPGREATREGLRGTRKPLTHLPAQPAPTHLTTTTTSGVFGPPPLPLPSLFFIPRHS